MLQNNLGNALREQGLLTANAGLLKQAEAAYRAALEVQTRQHVPQSWAGTQNNLGLLYEKTKRWELARKCYENIREFFPEYVAGKIKELEEAILRKY